MDMGMNTIQTLGELSSEEQLSAGGKGATLAQLLQAGYPVPNGFIILPAAFAAAEGDYREALRTAKKIAGREGLATYTGNLAELALDRVDWATAEALGSSGRIRSWAGRPRVRR